jgi:hypothetical protein
MNNETIITLLVFGYVNENLLQAEMWETESAYILEISTKDGLCISEDEINSIKESIKTCTPIKNEKWHKLMMQRVYYYDHSGPSHIYYELLHIQPMPHTCIRCGTYLLQADSDACDKYGVDPYCTQYCAEIANGVPLPYSTGALVFDKWINGNK